MPDVDVLLASGGLVQFGVFASSHVEVRVEGGILGGYRGRERPHSVSKGDWRPLG